jgi:virginiamycin B lyase
VGRITADGQITEYPLPDRSARPHAIIADPSDIPGNRKGSGK